MIFENGTWILIGMGLMILYFLYKIKDIGSSNTSKEKSQ